MRSLLVDIYPPSLRAGGLPAALDDLAKTVNGSDARLDISVDPQAAAALDADGQRASFRVAQEALRNALKHAQASVIRLELTRVESLVRLDVSDDGVGVDPEAAKKAATEGYFGLQLMADVAVYRRRYLPRIVSLISRESMGIELRVMRSQRDVNAVLAELRVRADRQA